MKVPKLNKIIRPDEALRHFLIYVIMNRQIKKEVYPCNIDRLVLPV